MRYYEILLEYNQSSIVNLFGDVLLFKWKQEGKPFIDQIGEETPEAILKWIEQFDPTQNKKYMTWIINKYAGKKGGISRLEDISSRLNDHLDRYERLSRKKKLKPEHKNINQIKTLVDLSQIVKQYEDEDISSKQEPTELTNKNVEVVYNGPDYSVLIPKTYEASKTLCKDAEWCTAYPNEYEEYSSQGPLYIIELKSTGERWQWHFESGQYMDIEDKEINIDEFLQKHKKVANIVVKHHGGLEKVATRDPNTWLKYIKNPSPEIQIAAVKQNSEAIQYIKNPSSEALLVAVEDNSFTMEFIENPSPEVQMAAVKQHSFVLRYIKNPSPEAQMTAVKQDGASIGFIENPSPEVQMAAVKQDGESIQYIKNPSPKVQIVAVKQNMGAVRYIDKKILDSKVKIYLKSRSWRLD